MIIGFIFDPRQTRSFPSSPRGYKEARKRWEMNVDDADVEQVDNEKGPVPISKRELSK